MSEPAAFDGFNGELGSPLSGGKRKKGNGHKATCGCPICKNMKKNKKGGVLLVGGALCPDGVTEDNENPDSCPVTSSDASPMAGGRRRRSRGRSRSKSRSRSRSRSRSSRKSMQGGRKSRKSKRRR